LIGAIPPHPLILVGEGWKMIMECFFAHQDKYIPVNQRKWLIFAADIEQAVALLAEGLAGS